MNDKLTYKIKNILTTNEYIDIIIKHKMEGTDVNIKNANIRFKYIPKTDKAYLSFENVEENTRCEIEDNTINEVIINDESLSIETDQKSYYCYKNKEKLYY